VFEDVGEGFLDDAVRRQFDHVGELAERVRQLPVDLDPGGRERVDQGAHFV